MGSNQQSFKDRNKYNIKMVLRNTFVGLSFLQRGSESKEAFQVSLHRAEAELLCQRLLSLLEKADESVAMVEGAYAGPPPTPEDLVGP